MRHADVFARASDVLGTEGWIAIETPFTPGLGDDCRLRIQAGDEFHEKFIPAVDQYRLQTERYSAAILEDGPVPMPIEDAAANMAAMDAVMRSGETGRWEMLVKGYPCE